MFILPDIALRSAGNCLFTLKANDPELTMAGEAFQGTSTAIVNRHVQQMFSAVVSD
jgi:hypothetical protein